MTNIYGIITLSTLALVVQSISLTLDSGTNLVLNSSMRRGSVSLSIASNGAALNSSFYVASQIISPIANKHRIVYAENKIQIEPKLNDEQINFNDFDPNINQYWLAIKHLIRSNGKSEEVNFIGLQIIDKQKVHSYLLPTFEMPFSFLAFGTIYRCGNSVIVAVDTHDDRLDMALFAKSGETSWKIPTGKWDWSWEKIDQNGLDFGRFTRKDKSVPIKIELKNGSFCEFIPINLQKANNIGLQSTGYSSILKVLQAATPLHLSAHQKDEL